MPRLLTFRCSNEVYDTITAALAVRKTGLFLLPPRDEDTDPKAALLGAIMSDWMRNLTPEGLSKARIVATGYMQELAAPLRPMALCAHERGMAQSVADDARDEIVEGTASVTAGMIADRLNDEVNARREAGPAPRRKVKPAEAGE